MDDRIRETINQLKALKLDDDSHENLSAICSALYGGKPDYGWTIGACSMLRDVLVGMLEQLDPSEWSDSYLAEHGLMRLPVDADGIPIHVGDEMDFSEGVRGLTVIGVGTSSVYDSDMGAIIRDDDGYTWFNARFLRHHHKPTIEDVLRELVDVAIGDIADKARNENMTYNDWVKSNEVIAEYADRLREVMNND